MSVLRLTLTETGAKTVKEPNRNVHTGPRQGQGQGPIVTAHKRSCGKVVFLHLSVILFTGEGGHASKQEVMHGRGHVWWACVGRRPLKRAVRILLECFLVSYCVSPIPYPGPGSIPVQCEYTITRSREVRDERWILRRVLGV